MTQYIVKIVLSVAILVGVSECSKRSSFFGGLLASLPLISVLAMIWLFQDTKNREKVSQLSHSIFWLVLPSLAFFIALPLLLKTRLNFYLSMRLSIVIMLACYGLMVLVLKKPESNYENI